MLSVLLPATRRSPAVVDIRAELAGRTECRKTPNLSFHPPTVPLARWIKKEDALEALAKDGATLRLDDLPPLGSPSLGDDEHSHCFLPLPLPLPLDVLPPPAPPLAGPQVFEEDEDGSEKQSILEWPGLWQKLQACSRWQSLLSQPFAELY